MLADRKKAIKRLVSLQKKELASLYSTGLAPEWERFILQLPERKLSKPSQRVQFVQFMYEYIAEYAQKKQIALDESVINKHSIIHLAVLAELVIDVQYYENYIIDGKNGANSTELLVKYNNAAAHLKSITFNYISDHFSDDLKIEKEIRNEIQLMFDMVNAGQQAEQCYNHYNSFAKGFDMVPDFGSMVEGRINKVYLTQLIDHFTKALNLSPKEINFLNVYLKRLNLTSVQLFKGFAELLLKLLKIENDLLKHQVLSYAEYFGYTVQLVNDNIDIVEMATGSKIPEDAFSDLLNKNITFPLFIHLVRSKKNSIVHKILDSKDMSRHASYEIRKHHSVVRMLKEKYSKKVCRALKADMLEVAIPLTKDIAKRAEGCLDKAIPSSEVLINMCEIAYQNRFYDVIEKIELSISEKLLEKINEIKIKIMGMFLGVHNKTKSILPKFWALKKGTDQIQNDKGSSKPAKQPVLNQITTL